MLLNPSALSLHQQLKYATSSIHESLHRNPLLHRLLKADCTRYEYSSVLRLFFSFYAAAEPRFAECSYAKFRAEVPTLQWLKDDLVALSVGQDFATVDPMDTATSPDFEEYLGYLYVKQGSTLGGQVLSTALAKSLGLSASSGLRFFSGFGASTRQNWQEFLEYLERVSSSVNPSAVTASAYHYFEMLEKTMKR